MKEETVTWLVAPVVGVLFLIVFYSVSYKAVLANKLLIKGMDVNRHIANKMPFNDILVLQKDSFRSAIDLKVVGSEEAREQFLQTAARMSQVQIPPELPQGEKQAIAQAMNDLIAAARQEVENSYPDYKDEVRALSIAGMFYNVIGDYASAEKVLSEAVAISPFKQVTAFDLIRSYLAQRKYNDAETLAKKIFLAAPEFGNAMKLYVITAIYANKLNEARTVLASVNKTISIDNDILSALIDAKQYDVAIGLLQQMKKEQPSLAGQIDDYIKTIVAKKGGN